MVRIACTFSTPIAFTDEEDYLRTLDIRILGWDVDGEHWRPVGRVFADVVLWSQAEARGVSLFDVCDGDSQGWYEVHRILTDKGDSIREDLQIDLPFNHVLFIHGVIVVPDLQPELMPVLDSVSRLYGHDVVVAMWLEKDLCSPKTLADLGFRKVAGERLIYRHNANQSVFSINNPNGLNINFTATEEHERWYVDEMKRLFPNGYFGVEQ